MKNILEILQHDHNVNHSSSADFLVSVEEILTKVTEGYSLLKQADTLILFRPLTDAPLTMEFHCYNGGSGSELIQNVLSFFEKCIQNGFARATTTYQRPSINIMFNKNISKDCLTIEQTPAGFTATVRL